MAEVRYKDCISGRMKLVRDVLESIEELVLKYKIEPEDYHLVRSMVRKRSFYLENLWLNFLARTVDERYGKKVNTEGEK